MASPERHTLGLAGPDLTWSLGPTAQLRHPRCPGPVATRTLWPPGPCGRPSHPPSVHGPFLRGAGLEGRSDKDDSDDHTMIGNKKVSLLGQVMGCDRQDVTWATLLLSLGF